MHGSIPFRGGGVKYVFIPPPSLTNQFRKIDDRSFFFKLPGRRRKNCGVPFFSISEVFFLKKNLGTLCLRASGALKISRTIFHFGPRPPWLGFSYLSISIFTWWDTWRNDLYRVQKRNCHPWPLRGDTGDSYAFAQTI